MEHTYVIDGYNVIHASPQLKRVMREFGSERARRDLVNAVAGFAESANATCIVVFDGVLQEERVTPRVTVVASGGNRTADEVIREQARRQGRRLMVVSSDLEIIATARVNMAEIIHAKPFAAGLRLGTHSEGLAAPSPGGDTHGSAARPHRIAELRERSEKPGAISRDELDEWRKLFGP